LLIYSHQKLKIAKVELYPINETPHAGNPKGVNESMPSPIPSPKAMFVVILFLFTFRFPASNN